MESLLNLDDRHKKVFAETLLKGLSRAPFGGTSKSELDYLLFVAMLNAKYISLDAPVFVTAQLLQITPARVKSMVYSYRLRTFTNTAHEQELAAAIAVAGIQDDGRVVLNVEDRYWRDTLTATLKSKGIYLDTSFNRERLLLAEEDFRRVLEQVFPDASMELRKALKAKSKATKIQKLKDAFAKGAATGAAKQAGVMTLSFFFTQVPQLLS